MLVLRIIVVLVALLDISFGEEQVNVTISNGDIIGSYLETKTGVNYYSFRGIPYAEPPVGKLRFQPPKPAQPWEGVLDTTKYGKTCLQYDANPEEQSEDCLFLNIHTPELTCNISLPSMVFLHGGGYRSGSGNFGPEYFVENGIILVTLNYRLGPFGFLSAQDTVIRGNAGLRDQRLALEWLHENIENFCGDPRFITVFGQSAGAASIGYHLMSSEGLFRAAIFQSGSPLSPFALQRDPKSVLESTVQAVANITNTSAPESSNSTSVLEYLQSVDSTAISAAAVVVSEELLASGYLPELVGFSYSPSLEVESEDAIITGPSLEKIANGSFIDVPVIIGTTSEEAFRYFTNSQLKEYLELYTENLEYLAPNGLSDDHQTVKEVGEMVKDFYSLSVDETLDEEQEAAGTAFFSDAAFSKPVLKQAQLQSYYASVHFYKFSYSGLLGGVNKTSEGKVPHYGELNYLFSSDEDINNYPENDILTSQRLVKLFTNFAKNLVPILSEQEIFQNVSWPRVYRENSTDIVYLNIGEDLSVETNPRGDSLYFWNTIFDDYGNPPFFTF